jgi:4-hydroxy-tetrahydrodipicolinate synthase
MTAEGDMDGAVDRTDLDRTDVDRDTGTDAAQPFPRCDILPATPVAFTRDGDLDLDGTAEIFRFVAASGVDGAFVLGTTGEFPSLAADERLAIAQLAAEAFAGLNLIVHVGAASAWQAERLAAAAVRLPVSGLAAITPYFFPPSASALLEYYRRVAAAADGLPVYVYAFAERTGVPVSPALMAEIAALPGVVGAKVSGESLDTIAALRPAVPDNFMIYTGSDRDLGGATAAGAQGVVSGMASVLPEPFLELRAAVRSGDADRVARAQADVDEVVGLIGGDPARIKAALRVRGVRAGYPRMALADPQDPADHARIERLVATRAGVRRAGG